MDYQALDFWWKVGITVMNAGVWLYLFLLNRNRVTNERINRMETHMTESIGGHGNRLTALEQDRLHAPNHADMARLYERVNSTAMAVSEMSGEMKGLNDNLRLILSRIAERGMQ